MPRIRSKFRGYSSVGTTFLSPVRFDLDLATQDLLNHFNTRKGERVMMPTFGSIIWEILFDPLDDRTVALIEQDVRQVVGNDPRWTLQTVTTTETPNSLELQVTVTYNPTSETVVLPLTYNKGTNTI